MAWADLYADAAIFYNLNNNFTPVINTGVAPQAAVLDGLNGSGESRLYSLDAPPGSGYTHSLRLNGYGTQPRTKRLKLGTPQSYTNNTGYSSFGESINFWFKVLPTSSETSTGPAITLFRRERGASDESFGYGGGTNYMDSGSNAGKFTWTNQTFLNNTGVVTTHNSSSGQHVFVQSVWYNITIVWATHQTGPNLADRTIERAIYCNGALAHNSYVQNVRGWDPLDDLEFFFTSTTGTNEQIMSSLALWNRMLTLDEIENLAFNNYTRTNYEDYNNIITDSPGVQYYTTLNNPNKQTDAEVFGTSSSWGSFNDSSSAISVNEQSKFGKSWKFDTLNSTVSQEVDVGTAALKAINTGLQETFRTANVNGFSIEFWLYAPTASSISRRILYADAGSFSNGSMTMSINLFNGVGGYPAATVPRFSTGTTFLSLSVTPAVLTSSGSAGSALVVVPPSNLQSLLRYWSRGTYDGKWHHIVLTNVGGGSGSEQSGTRPAARLYMDGIFLGDTSHPSTGWNMVPSSLIAFFLGTNSNNSVQAPPIWFDKFAIYNRRLTIREVAQHFRTGKEFINQSALVKHWDGTAWQDALGAKVYVNNPQARYIRWSANGNSVNLSTHFVEIQAFDQQNVNRLLNVTGTILTGTPVGTSGPISSVTNGSTAINTVADYLDMIPSTPPPSLQWDMGQVHNLKNIKFWHWYTIPRSYNNVKIETSIDGTNWQTVYEKASTPATINGTTVNLGWSNWEAQYWNGMDWKLLSL